MISRQVKFLGKLIPETERAVVDFQRGRWKYRLFFIFFIHLTYFYRVTSFGVKKLLCDIIDVITRVTV